MTRIEAARKDLELLFSALSASSSRDQHIIAYDRLYVCLKRIEDALNSGDAQKLKDVVGGAK
jgi:hypothetical protein